MSVSRGVPARWTIRSSSSSNRAIPSPLVPNATPIPPIPHPIIEKAIPIIPDAAPEIIGIAFFYGFLVSPAFPLLIASGTLFVLRRSVPGAIAVVRLLPLRWALVVRFACLAAIGLAGLPGSVSVRFSGLVWLVSVWLSALTGPIAIWLTRLPGLVSIGLFRMIPIGVPRLAIPGSGVVLGLLIAGAISVHGRPPAWLSV